MTYSLLIKLVWGLFGLDFCLSTAKFIELKTILELVEGFYEEKVYQGSDQIESPLFPQINLTAEQILQGS